MTAAEFTREMNRLTAQFKGSYSDERIKIIAKEVEHLPAQWWKRTVDRLIGEHRQAPLLPEIRELVSRERERNWSSQKKEHAQDARDFWRSSYHPDETKVIFQTIKARMLGQVSDDDWSAFMRGLEGVAKGGAA